MNLIMMIVIDYNKSAVFSALHDELVSTATLANVAKHIGLGDIILCSVSTYGYSSKDISITVSMLFYAGFSMQR